MLREELMKMLDGREDDMIALRRHFHEHPELSFDEKETAAFIARFYENKSVDVQTNVGNGYGIIVTIKGNKPGRTIALRADFDALQIEEQTGLPFASKNHGVMHACGHDGHTAYLMILADCLIRLRDQWEGTVKIVHQHAEEMAPAGAKSIMDSGLLDDVDEIYGIHFYPDYEVGTVFYTSGFAYAGCSDIKVTIQGTGGHGSQPHRSNDTIVAASSFVMNLQTIVSRRINTYDMAVVTIGSFEAVGSSNVIKDSLILRGDARYMDLEVGKVIEEHFHRIGRGLEEMYNVKVEIDYNSDYPPLYNHPKETAKAVAVLEQNGVGSYLNQVIATSANTGAEDFGQYLLKIPGAFLNVGARPNQAEVFNNHHPKFDINEKALLVAAKAVADITLAALSAK